MREFCAALQVAAGALALEQRIKALARKVAESPASTVLITGESGTGKEVVAQTVHDLSRRRKQPFLAVNCGAISPRSEAKSQARSFRLPISVI